MYGLKIKKSTKQNNQNIFIILDKGFFEYINLKKIAKVK